MSDQTVKTFSRNCLKKLFEKNVLLLKKDVSPILTNLSADVDETIITIHSFINNFMIFLWQWQIGKV
jgi:hypothetical protein